jgi:predicted metal-dependent hydrolase
VPVADEAVKLLGGRFVMPKALARDGREHMIRWYIEHAKPWLWAKVQDYAARMEVNPAGLRVQDLGFRWGSCGKGEVLYFHWKSILLPAPMAEYVVVHEMAHLQEAHHTPAFWLRVKRAMPDYAQRKTWLAARGIEVEGL